jgi:type VI secretion system secreted protein Hcp
MKTLRENRVVHVLVVALVLGAVATMGAVGLPGEEPSAAILAAGSGGTPAVQSFFDVFLEIQGIPGESTSAAHNGSIEVLSWSWGVSQTSTGGAGGGAGAVGRATGHVTLIKRIDKATPLLFKRCVDGTPIPLATVYLARPDGQTYLKYELKNVMVSSIVHGGDVNGDGLPDETLELTFSGAKLTYTQFDAANKPIGQTTGEW